MEKIKILELLTWAEKNDKKLKHEDLRKLVRAGLVREKHDSFLCISSSSLNDVYKANFDDKEIVSLVNEWMTVIREFRDDEDYHLKKLHEADEIQKIEEYFEKQKLDVQCPSVFLVAAFSSLLTFVATLILIYFTQPADVFTNDANPFEIVKENNTTGEKK